MTTSSKRKQITINLTLARRYLGRLRKQITINLTLLGIIRRYVLATYTLHTLKVSFIRNKFRTYIIRNLSYYL